ncbi:hypothetical protein SlGVgp096 [Spodoptera litura granulovirus]|uniref:Ac78 n=1 Tax=Spodoptera litura granulovirus TaxID=359919 RepID=A5IZU8_9BBAC|nr:hypothetical protein SlGVgp096 [Spodoptera litura granulovirus]ABQ52039.1 hypothetical protein SlGVgp096 [Spodoptera litura granulovirus]
MNKTSVQVPFEKLSNTDALDAIPLKLAYTKNDAPQSFYANESSDSPNADNNIWIVIICSITILALIIIISYYIITTLYDYYSVEDEFEYEDYY